MARIDLVEQRRTSGGNQNAWRAFARSSPAGSDPLWTKSRLAAYALT